MAKYKYIGDGSYLPGIPARDLDDDDWEQLTADQKKAVRDNAKHGEGVAIFEEATKKKGD
jgi:hypothetical protein